MSHLVSRCLPTFICLFVLSFFDETRGAVPIGSGRRYAGVWPEPMNIPVFIASTIPQQYVASIDTAITLLNRQVAGGNCIRLQKITALPTGSTSPVAPTASALPDKPFIHFTNAKLHNDRLNPGEASGDGTTTAPTSTNPLFCDAFVGVDLRRQTATPGEQVVTLLWETGGAAGRIPCLRESAANNNNNNVRVIMALIVRALGLWSEISRSDRLGRIEFVTPELPFGDDQPIPNPNAPAIMQLFGAIPSGAGFDLGPFDCNSITMPDPLLYSFDGRSAWWRPSSEQCQAISTATVGTTTQISQRDCLAIALLMNRRSPGCGITLNDMETRCQDNLPSTP